MSRFSFGATGALSGNAPIGEGIDKLITAFEVLP
jgi:hypothetical protein